MVRERLESVSREKVGMATFVPEDKSEVFRPNIVFRREGEEKVFHPETSVTRQYVLL
jgi:hypothetical protein